MADTVIERKVYQEGQTIFRQGDPGNCAYVVQAGNVDILKISDDGEALIGRVGQGGIFGEMALIDEAPRMATARAAEMTTVIIVNKKMFEEKMSRTDPFVRRLLGILAESARAVSR